MLLFFGLMYIVRYVSAEGLMLCRSYQVLRECQAAGRLPLTTRWMMIIMMLHLQMLPEFRSHTDLWAELF